MTKTYSDHDRSISCDVGEDFKIKLESNPTTGFVWRLVGKQDKIDIEELQFEPGTENIGAPGHQKFKIQANTPGSIKLKFEYVQPWEGNPDRECEFKLDVS